MNDFNDSNYNEQQQNEIQQEIEVHEDLTKLMKKCVEYYRKLCNNGYNSTNNTLIIQLKSDQLNLFLDNYSLNDIKNISKILKKFKYFQHIFLTLKNSNSETSTLNISKKYNNNSNQKQKKAKNNLNTNNNIKFSQKLLSINIAVSDYLKSCQSLITFNLDDLKISNEMCNILSEGFQNNSSLKALKITRCKFNLEGFEILIKGLFSHENIAFLDLSNNNFSDKFGNIISRLITRQTQRRDQIIWAYGLRNEVPNNNEYANGLISISLRDNNFSKDSAEQISNSLGYDNYIRCIDLNNNNLDKNSCKKFIKMMRKNNCLLTVDLQNNPGYDEEIHARIVMKMSKNIKQLYINFMNGEYEKEEFENLKEFVDISFFDVDIPQEIIQIYNNEISGNNEEIDDKNNNNNNNNNNQDEDVIQEENEEDNNSKLQNSTQNNVKISKNNSNQKKQDKNLIEKENQDLMEENLQLKAEILKLRAKDLKSSLKDKNDSKITENYERILRLLNELNLIENEEEEENENENENENEIVEKIISDKKNNHQIKEEELEESKKEDKKDEESNYNMEAEPSEETNEIKEDNKKNKKNEEFNIAKLHQDIMEMNQEINPYAQLEQYGQYYDVDDEDMYYGEDNKMNKSF